MNLRQRQQELTRHAILDALAEVIAESGLIGTSMQQIADRAGVAHRTLYNHFPTREALNDAFAEYLEEVLARAGQDLPAADFDLEKLREQVGEAFATFERHESHLRASVILMIASRAAASVSRARTRRFERLIAAAHPRTPRAAARPVAAAIRMFFSSTGWHLLTEHYGLSTADAAQTAAWACDAMLTALGKGSYPRTRTKGRS
jgi:AcrR family transcriptional regulator